MMTVIRPSGMLMVKPSKTRLSPKLLWTPANRTAAPRLSPSSARLAGGTREPSRRTELSRSARRAAPADQT